MNVKQVLKELRALGTAQNRKVYARHGVTGEQFGVSYANLGKLTKQVGRDQALAEALWASGNHDARVLATMVADPDSIGSRCIEAWKKDLDDYVVTDAFTKLVGQTRFARRKAETWTRSKREFVGQAGWGLVSMLAMEGELSDSWFEPYLETIEASIHSAENRTRHAMNMALISIGLRSTTLRKKAVAAARRIGKVEVDHGETSCKTPDAVAYIEKARGRRKPARR